MGDAPVFFLFLFALPLLLIGAVVVGVFALLVPLLGFLISLPFRILGVVFSVVGFALVLPFLLLGGALAIGGVLLALLIGGGVLLLPLLPFALFVAGVVWLVRRGGRHAVHA